ncbi:MAG TPA: NAD(P)H-dependent oxidoreductase [Sphingobacteriaceae bacterium]
MKTGILTGSIRKGRQSHKVAVFLKLKLEEKGIEVDLIDLSEHPLPLYGAVANAYDNYDKNIKTISNRLHDTDALIFVTPEYHGSFSGVIKNAIDHFWSEFQKKPIAVATASAGRMGGINASTQLQHVILSIGAYPLPLKFLAPEVQTIFDSSNNPVSQSLANAADKFLDEFLWLAEAVTQKKKNELQPV